MKNKKGFTLVEILAVLVVLLVIVLIAINVVNSRVKQAKKNSVEVNANNYIKAVNGVAALSQNIGEDMEKGTYQVRDLNKTEIKLSGEKPRKGFLVLSDYEVTYGCLMYEDYSAIILNGKTSEVEKMNCNNFKLNGEFAYKGSEEVFTVALSGTYKIEVWGAQGGNSHDLNVFGGYGGYSVGYIDLKKNDKLYINVGEQGQNVTSDVLSTSYNGGASCRTNAASRSCGNGGGATSVALKSGQLKNLTNSASDIVIVAGGGGGASTHDSDTTTSGGSGGGYIGSSGSSTRWGFGTGGTQIAGGERATTDANAQNGSFGLGGNGALNAGAGGGGGFYGGGGGHGGSGGGGSGYIGNSKLFIAAMYCYNCTTSNVSATKTISVTCAEEDPTPKCAKKGSGYVSITYSPVIEVSNDVPEFSYVNGEQVYYITTSGTYKLEVWGAQGGSGYNNNAGTGGYGAYSTGIVSLNKGDKLYINVGGVGGSTTSKTEDAIGGYNGGGNSYHWRDGTTYNGAGGGATSIATKSGLLSTLSGSLGDILIVAGGGGGGASDGGSHANGGAGGGYIGNNGQNPPNYDGSKGLGGTQNEGGSYEWHNRATPNSGLFGQGANSSPSNSTNGGGGTGAGGGYYGGGSGGVWGGAGGGSGYIGNSKLTNAEMKCFNCTESPDKGLKTTAVNCAEENPNSNCAKKGHGYAKITLLN